MVFVRGLIAGPSGTMMSFSAVLKKTGPRSS